MPLDQEPRAGLPALVPPRPSALLTPNEAGQVLTLVERVSEAVRERMSFRERLARIQRALADLDLEQLGVQRYFEACKRIFWDEASLAFRMTFIASLLGSAALVAGALVTGKMPRGGFVAPSHDIAASVKPAHFFILILMTSATAGVATEMAVDLANRARGSNTGSLEESA